jgi:glucokinase
VADYAIGIDMGGTNVKLAALTAAGQALCADHFGTADDSAAAWMKRIPQAEARIEKEYGPAKWIGGAAPGLVARDQKTIQWMMGRLESVVGVNWADLLKRPAAPVINDAHAALLGEVWQGAARGKRNVAMLTLGTGVGGALMVEGCLLRGHLGRAGHLGHMSLNPWGEPDIVGTPGSLEDSIGECTLQQRCGGAYHSTREMVARAAEGDPNAREIWLRGIRALAAGMVSIINAADPEVFILGGGMINAGPMLFEPLARELDSLEWRPCGGGVTVAAAELGDRAGAIGAAYHAIKF